MKVILALSAILALTACGVDGPPVRPAAETSAGTRTGGNDSKLGSDWISGTINVHTAVSL
jgi:predicted small lipoprotein YifL